jgi:excisionase family DNA binding protein
MRDEEQRNGTDFLTQFAIDARAGVARVFILIHRLLLAWRKLAVVPTSEVKRMTPDRITRRLANGTQPKAADGSRGNGAARDFQLLTADEAAVLLCVRRTTVYELVRSNDLPCVRIGRRQMRFLRADLERWILSSRTRFRR